MKKLYLILIGFFACTAAMSQHAMEVMAHGMSKHALPQSNGLRKSTISMQRLMDWSECNECMEDDTTQQTVPVVPQACSTSSIETATAQSVQSQPSNPIAPNTQQTEFFWQALNTFFEDYKSALLALVFGAQPDLKTISAEESNNKIYPLVVYLIKHAHKKNEYNSVDLLKKLITLGLKVNTHPNKEISLLNYAINRSFKYTQNSTIKTLIKELIAADADITASVQSQDQQTFEILLTCGADATKMFNIFATLKIERQANLFELLLKAGASIIEFVKQNNTGGVRWLIEHGAQLNHPSSALLLHTAAANNNHQIVDLLLAYKINLTYADPQNQDATAIQIPICNAKVAMVEKLLKAGVPPYKKGSPEERLMLAIEKNDMQAAIVLLVGNTSQRKANPNLVTDKGQHILVVALENKNREMAAKLMQHGCKLDYIITQGNVSAINTLLEIQQEHIANISKQSTELLNFALERQKSHWLEMVETLLKHQASHEAIFHRYESLYESLKNDPALLKKLTTLTSEEYAKINPSRASFMHFAATLESPRTLITLATTSPELCKSKDRDGNTPLHYAAQRNNISTTQDNEENQRAQLTQQTQIIIKHLVQAGADINAQNNNGDTPLLIAARYNNFIAIKTLVLLGANPAIPNKQNITPLTIADLYKEEALVKELEAEVKTSTSSENCHCIARRTE
jgi:ankyrin repeat protein